jgi:hypothetical protein
MEFINEAITFGVISLSSVSPVQSCHDSALIYAYPGTTYAITAEAGDDWKRRANIQNSDKANIVFGGYDNNEHPE